MNCFFKRADILLPRDVDMTLWATIACDQYTSQPEYWKDIAKKIGVAPSTLAISLPEIYLEDADVEKRIANIHGNMRDYLANGLFNSYNGFVFVERTLENGEKRHGIVGCIDLEAYDYTANSLSAVRATEGTIVSRLPPRVHIREEALLELPHILVLYDDPSDCVVKDLINNHDTFTELYNFNLLKCAGSIRGSLLDGAWAEKIETAFAGKYDDLANISSNPLLFAVGDGNHSLAAAKQCYENLKSEMSSEEYLVHPARYVLVEMVNIHDSSLNFEPIYRVMFGVDPANVLKEAETYYAANNADNSPQSIKIVTGEIPTVLRLKNPPTPLVVSTTQNFIDYYLNKFGGTVDYIHGEDEVARLSAFSDSVGFIYDGMQKSELFSYVETNGALPRKTFSMGESADKRFYLECRKIVK